MRLRKSPGWATQQLALLKLPEEIQQRLSSGPLPERDGRFLARTAKDFPELSPAGLLALLEQRKASDAEKRVRDKQVLAAHAAAQNQKPTAQPFTAVKTPSGPSVPDTPPATPEKQLSTAAPSPSGTASAPEPRDPKPTDVETAAPESDLPDSSAVGQPIMVDIRKMPHVPWHDGNGVADLVFEKMDNTQREVLLERLLAGRGDG
ncbi:hypothetical protein [Streptomyces sp. NPDC000410]|uniref:hypothetical protein n=1 Tax=Streptomyces sp. NPDC000410 TaxID=3154254 RepID=UPI0033170EA1